MAATMTGAALLLAPYDLNPTTDDASILASVGRWLDAQPLKIGASLLAHFQAEHAARVAEDEPGDDIAPGEFERSKLAGYDVEPNGFGGGWFARDPDGEALSDCYESERAAWEACDDHRRQAGDDVE